MTMKQLLHLLAILALSALLLTSCGDDQGSIAPSQETNLLVATSGVVRLKRDGWKDFVPVAAGARLQPTDLLEAEGSATVLCAGPQVKTLTALGRTPCPTDRGSFVYDGARFSSSQRAAIPQDLPYILHPRSTLVLDNRPLLIWHDSGAAPYSATIVDGAGERVWEQAGVTGTPLQYPEVAPALQPGADYLLIVQDARGKTSEDDPAKGLGFRVLSPEARSAVEQRRDAILALGELDDSSRQLALAVSYATWTGEGGRGLWGETWQILEQVVLTRDTSAVRLWMGDVLRAISLPDEAEATYQEALRQAEASGDRASQAAAEAGLWRVSGEQTRLDAALRLYEELGEQREAAALRGESGPNK
jgi:hypothetical protein